MLLKKKGRKQKRALSQDKKENTGWHILSGACSHLGRVGLGWQGPLAPGRPEPESYKAWMAGVSTATTVGQDHKPRSGPPSAVLFVKPQDPAGHWREALKSGLVQLKENNVVLIIWQVRNKIGTYYLIPNFPKMNPHFYNNNNNNTKQVSNKTSSTTNELSALRNTAISTRTQRQLRALRKP